MNQLGFYTMQSEPMKEEESQGNTSFRVFQDGIRCKDYQIEGWDIDTFPTQYEAEIFTLRWVYPFTEEHAKANYIKMELGKEHPFNILGVTLRMKIEEVFIK